MSDHIYGSEAYYLESINETLHRLVDGMRELLNLEHEGMVLLRGLHRQRDQDRQDMAERDLTCLLYDLKQYVYQHTDFIKDSISRMDLQPLRRLGDLFEQSLYMVIKETEKRINAMEETAALLNEDAKRL